MNVGKANEKPKKDSKDAKKELSNREKALEFAKQIRKPVKPLKFDNKSSDQKKGDVIDHMTYLEEQHRLYQERVRELASN